MASNQLLLRTNYPSRWVAIGADGGVRAAANTEAELRNTLEQAGAEIWNFYFHYVAV